jgi:Domain of unknown function (DUF4258)
MDFYISRHTEEQCEQRGISSEMLNTVLQNPQQVIEDAEGKRIYQSQVYFASGKTYLIRAIVSEKTKPAIVITVYKTSQISRYWRSE